MFELFMRLWYLWLLMLIAVSFRLFKPVIKGWLGEKTVSLYLHMLPQTEYAVMNDVILSTDTGTTQIDHVVVSFYGIFVIETKNYKGWIYGNEDSEQWTQKYLWEEKQFYESLASELCSCKSNKSPFIPIPQPAYYFYRCLFRKL